MKVLPEKFHFECTLPTRPPERLKSRKHDNLGGGGEMDVKMITKNKDSMSNIVWSRCGIVP